MITCIAIPLAVGTLSSLLTKNSMENFAMLQKPTFAPPGFLFPVVWTILYVLMGIASYLVLTSGKPTGNALIVYGIQLVFNFFWSILFFNLGLCMFAFLWLVLLWLLILLTTVLFYQILKPAGYLMIPYLLWVTFAGYLNLGICLLN
ncbi:tryptophan-rich sensory protein [Roseburia intestinalis]|nr:TspO/MBR family protein [Roseburia intestinalis]UQT32515.1 tryptophan-rich sensory protein [Roseburia intestinalis]